MNNGTVAEEVRARNMSAAQAMLVAKRFPDAILDERIGGFFASNAVEPDRVIVVDGDDRLVPTQRIESDGVATFVAKRSYHYRYIPEAIEFLREKFPEAYAGLVEWACR